MNLLNWLKKKKEKDEEHVDRKAIQSIHEMPERAKREHPQQLSLDEGRFQRKNIALAITH